MFFPPRFPDHYRNVPENEVDSGKMVWAQDKKFTLTFSNSFGGSASTSGITPISFIVRRIISSSCCAQATRHNRHTRRAWREFMAKLSRQLHTTLLFIAPENQYCLQLIVARLQIVSANIIKKIETAIYNNLRNSCKYLQTYLKRLGQFE